MHPVQLKAEYHERQSRLTTFFRLLLLIPHVVVIYLYSIVASVVLLLAWFAALFVGRNPFWDFLNGYTRYTTRVYGYSYLICDRFPPFGSGGEYPIDAVIERVEGLSRVKVFFRLLLAIPAAILAYVLNAVAQLVAIALWFVILFVGRCPQGIFDFMSLALRYQLRLTAYLYLLTDRYPSLEDAAPEYSTRPAPPTASGQL